MSRPALSVDTIKSEILRRLDGGKASHTAVKQYIRKKYPDNELKEGNFTRAVEQLVRSGKIEDKFSRLKQL